MATEHWPLFDLVVRTPRLELRHPDDEMLVEVAHLTDQGVHEPGATPFQIDWAELPTPRRYRESMQWWWRCRAGFRPDDWHLTMVAVVGERPVGVQDLFATRFPARRSLESGSWLAKPFQGNGLGKEMRAAILHLGFEGLGALEAHSGAFAMNPASIGVSHSVGYSDNGEEITLRGGKLPERILKFRMSRAAWEDRRRADIEIGGLGACLEMFGLGPDRQPLLTDTSIS